MKTAQIVTAFFLTVTALMSGCANTDSRPTSSSSSYYGVAYGKIDAIEITRDSSSSGIGAGAVIGGIIIGLIESIGPRFMTASWTEGIVYGLFLLVLFVKPSGLFGVKYDW